MIHIVEELQMVGLICLQVTGEVFLSTDHLTRPLDQAFHCFTALIFVIMWFYLANEYSQARLVTLRHCR